MTNEITLPWPKKELGSNARICWQAKARHTKVARKLAFYTAKEAGLVAPETDGKLHLWIDFYRNIYNEPDCDGMLSRCKAYLDGIADALNVNDNRFICHPFIKNELGGKVIIRITSG